MFSPRSWPAASRSRSSASHCLQLLRRALTLVRQHNVLRRPTERSRRRCIILQGALHTGPHAEQRRQARTLHPPHERCCMCPQFLCETHGLISLAGHEGDAKHHLERARLDIPRLPEVCGARLMTFTPAFTLVSILTSRSLSSRIPPTISSRTVRFPPILSLSHFAALLCS